MIIKTIPVEMVKLHPLNPRKDLQPGDADFERLRRCIEAFGFVEPSSGMSAQDFLSAATSVSRCSLNRAQKRLRSRLLILMRRTSSCFPLRSIGIRGSGMGEARGTLKRDSRDGG